VIYNWGVKLIVGLGNPEKNYFNHRHNVGFMVIDYLQKNLHSADFFLKKSDQFMNKSGLAVSKFAKYYIQNTKYLYVAHDDLDIPLGEFKIQFAKGPKLHNGIESVEKALSTKDFWRIRIGVDNRDSDNRIPGEKYVLEDFTQEEKKILNTVFEQISKNL